MGTESRKEGERKREKMGTQRVREREREMGTERERDGRERRCRPELSKEKTSQLGPVRYLKIQNK